MAKNKPKGIVALELKSGKAKYVKHGLYLDVKAIDGRTRLGKTITALKKELSDFVGKPTIVSELLVQRITYKSIKLLLYESTQLHKFKTGEADNYLPMANSLRLDLQVLAQLAKKPKAPNLDEYLGARYTKCRK